MTYTIKIDQTSQQAQSIVDMLKALSVDYDFIQIYKNDEVVDLSVVTELDSRYEYIIKNPTVGKSWDEVKQNLKSQ
jgi:hypothetical protein